MQGKQRVFSGVQPSGNLHLGNYLGALKNWVSVQNLYENYFCIVDLHAITVPQDPKVLRQKVREVAAVYLAVGLDPEKSVIFRQSQVSGHAELAWLLNCVAKVGEISRMTQFKDKAQKGGAEAGKAIFTMVFADDGSGWKRVIAQKWQSEVPAVSAVHPTAPEDRVPPASGIAVHFNEGVTVTASTFHLECPAGTPVAVTATPEPLSDDSSFLLLPARSLPAGADCKLKVVAGQVSDPRFGQTMAADYTFAFKVAAGS